MTCAICCMEFTSVARKNVECAACHEGACVKCTKTYLLEVQDPHCMHCRTEWNAEFIDEHFSRRFRTGELARHRKEYLLNREKARLPDTVDEAEHIKKQRELQKRYDQLTAVIAEMRENELNMTLTEAHLQELDNYKQEGATLWQEIQHMYIYRRPEAQEKREFIRACPINDCRGFLSSQWKCKLCHTHVCSSCHEVREEEGHECDPGNVETAKLLAKDTKPCPKCATMIFKIDGCDQMWCLTCKTAFSWRTLRIETGRIHNPEYYRWMRENGHQLAREPGDNGACPVQDFDLPWLHDLHYSLQMNKGIWHDMIPEALRFLTHIRFDTMPRLRIFNDNQLDDPDKDLRIKYLLYEIDEEQWKRTLLMREKTREKKRVMLQIYDMLVAAGTDLMHRCMLSSRQEELNETMQALEALRVYFNQSCQRVNHRFNTTLVRPLNVNWIEVDA